MNINLDIDLVKKQRKKLLSNKDLIRIGIFKNIGEISNRKTKGLTMPPVDSHDGCMNLYDRDKVVAWILDCRQGIGIPTYKESPFGNSHSNKPYISETEELSIFVFEASPDTEGLMNEIEEQVSENGSPDVRLSVLSGMNEFRRMRDIDDC